MPRDLPIGNGDMLVAYDRLFQLRDLYWPHVGMPNHTQGHPQRFGVWADGDFVWLDQPGWERELGYVEDSLVTNVRLRHSRLGVELTCRDAVDYYSPVLFRTVEVRDLWGRARDIRVFFHVDLSIDESAIGDTVNYDPKLSALIAYKDNRYFLINGTEGRTWGITHWATGAKRIGDAEGTWRDAEDGHLSRNPIAQGSVDAVVGFHLAAPANGTARACLWLAAGTTYAEVKALDDKVRTKTPDRMMLRSEAYWRLWCRKEPNSLDPLPERLQTLARRSALTIRTQSDNRGAIIAANDYDITHFAGDTYSYMWPRDGALVAFALTLSGQSDLCRRFFSFCARVISPDGYFLHKYNPTGTLASSWHPWMMDSRRTLPVQQDETALVVWAFRQHFTMFRDVEFLRDLYAPLVVEPGNWMMSYRDSNGLPLPSWDLWEERRGIHLFTVASVIGALEAAAAFSSDLGAFDRAAEYTQGATQMREAMVEHFWSEERAQFARMLTPLGGGAYRQDWTLDSSAAGLFKFGALPAGDGRVARHMHRLKDALWCKTSVGGVARYHNDYYHQVERSDTARVPGNPWIICTLWLAQWHVERATTHAELEEALPLLHWAADRAFASGVLPEQCHPYTGEPISVSPLTWSHSTFLATCQLYARRHRALVSSDGHQRAAPAGMPA
ncbi:MAG: glycoside hydrolase family 15 protein [Planctomycetota bacterium]|nr:glycoside hydrolase family 15 protein [Planctomycetota bacterium]